MMHGVYNFQSMIVFHGTNKSSAQTIVGPPPNVDVTKGELGRGFYVGENISLAKTLAVGKYGTTNEAVVEFDIDNSKFVGLNVKTISKREKTRRLWRNLIRRGRSHTHLFNVDVVCAPFATIDFSYQYKFESIAAQNVLNSSPTKIL